MSTDPATVEQDASAGWIRATWPAPAGVQALTTTRGTNVGNRNDEGQTAADATRRAVQAATLGNDGHLQWLEQVHGNGCIRADAGSCRSLPQADAAWTNERGVGLVIQTADCVPVALAAADGHSIGAAHGGWRGLTDGVIESLVAAMRSGGAKLPLIAWAGPAIGPEAYEVGADVHGAVLAATSQSLEGQFFRNGQAPDKWHLDLFALTDWLLRQAGVKHIACERICTWSNAHLYSHRRDGATGRMATVVWMAP